MFVDLLPDSTNIDLDHLRTLLDDRTACVLVTHYHVNQNNMAEIARLCRDRGVALFEDCAICFGAEVAGRPAGTAGDAAVFSLSGFKIVNFFWGGFIVTAIRSFSPPSTPRFRAGRAFAPASISTC